MLGFSDAKLAVVKRGGQEVHAQGLLADYIGQKVCPEVYRFVENGYEMEILVPPYSRERDALSEVYSMLSRDVWPRRPYNRFYQDHSGWLIPLMTWSNTAPWTTQAIADTYLSEPTEGYCLIHGDPALSNLMQRQNGELVITDPMPRLPYRREMPSRKEVDLGKLVQSAMGWERILGEQSSLPSMWQDVDVLMSMLPLSETKPALLWGAIHLARVAIRAKTKQNSRIERWATDSSKALISWMKEY